jgi:penicillin-binding protein 1C
MIPIPDLISRYSPLLKKKSARLILTSLSVISLLLLLFFLTPVPRFNKPTCTVLISERGELLGATIATDEQYRFPPTGQVPEKFARCIIEFEDRFFYRHPGINPFSVLRAAWNNIRAGRVVQGGSTITMQTVRLWREGRNRTMAEKMVEALLSLRLEVAGSKDEILSMYCSNAPFGGNVVGLDAAAWRYFGREAKQLSWAEAAALAVLPNSPALVHPGRNPDILLGKRNRLLKRLYSRSLIDSTTYTLSLLEPLPAEPHPLPQLAPHLLTRVIRDGHRGKMTEVSINPILQERAIEVLDRHHRRLMGNQINNAAILVLDVTTGKALVYVGNTPGELHGNHVDIIISPRSTGSILKPFLYASLLHDGSILPHSLVPDIPTQIGGYSPKNFNPGYDGAVPASRAISRSLNIPAVRLLQRHGIETFHHLLNTIGLTTVTRSPEDYGLSLILGGAEATLWDLAGVYAGMARSLNSFVANQSRYPKNGYRTPTYMGSGGHGEEDAFEYYSVLDASAIYHCFEAMREVSRPDEQTGWQYFSSSRSVAWKTGTSFGHRDAWAIGLNSGHVVAVWAGNASGEGRPGLTGVSVAAPILFDIFALLPPAPWFPMPMDDMAHVPVCLLSGHRASDICMPTGTGWIPVKGLETQVCPYHHLIHLNQEETHRVTDRCVSVSEMVIKPWFILPPAMEWFYKSRNSFYRQLPPYPEGCEPDGNANPMALLYPRIENAKIFIPKDFDGNLGEALFEVAHRDDNITIYWHLNNIYMGQTKTFHKMGLSPGEGEHMLTLADERGNILEVNFGIAGR